MKFSDFQKASRIQDLIKDIPTDCKVTSYDFSIVVKGNLKSMHVSTEDLNEIGSIVNSMSEKKIFIDDIKSTCRTKHKSKYTVIFE